MRNRHLVVLVLAVALLVLVMAPLAAAFETVDVSGASGAANRALDYLKGRQQSDGGFAEPGGSGSSDQLTTWVVCAVAAAGKDASSWRKSGKSPLDFLTSRAGGWSKLTELEKGCLAASSAKANPRSFGGRNLVDGIKNHMAADGHIGDMVNEHCWGIIALASAGESVPESSRGWLAARQNIDGGFGFSADSGSDPDDTGAALQALMAAGESSKSNTVSRALSYLHFCQVSDGGFAWQSDESNVGSTAWAAQGIAATGGDAGSGGWARSGKTPIDFLLGQQQSDGHVRHMASLDSNPAWMTAEAIPAILKRPLPLSSGDTPVKPDSGPTNRSDSVNSTSVTSDSSSNTGSDADSNSGASGGAGTTGSGGQSSGRRSSGGSALARNTAAAFGGGNGTRDSSPGGGLLLFLVICAAYVGLVGLVYAGLRLFFHRQV